MNVAHPRDIGARPQQWQIALRDDPNRPPPGQVLSLWCLALRLDWRTGTGRVAVSQLVKDSGLSDSTVRRALRWALNPTGHRYLERLQRGHRTRDGESVSSAWRLLLPTQPVTGDLLANTQPVTGDLLTPTQPVNTPDPTGHYVGGIRTRGINNGRALSARAATQPVTVAQLCRRCGAYGHQLAECPN